MSVPIINGKRVEIADMNATHMLDILRGDECYTCSRKKQAYKSHCYGCWMLLPSNLRRALRAKMGRGYEDAYRTSLEWLARHKVSKADLIFGPM